MESAAAAMLEAGVGRFSRAPAMAAALLAEMWAPLAVALAALATLPSLLRRLQHIVLRIRSRGKEVIQSHIAGAYGGDDDDDYSSSGDDSGDEDDEEGSSQADTGSSGAEDSSEESSKGLMRRIGFYEEDGGGFPWGGAVVRTWQGRFSGCVSSGAGVGGAPAAANVPAVRLWGASTASGEQPWWWALGAGEGDSEASAPAPAAAPSSVVVGWPGRDHTQAAQKRRRRRAAAAVPAVLTGTGANS